MPTGTKLIYKDVTLRLERLEKGNILCATLLETSLYSEVNLKDAFFTTMEAIERFAVKKVIFHSNEALLNLPDAAYAVVMEVLISGLTATRVEQAAYIFRENSAREHARTAAIAALLEKMDAPVALQLFTDKKHALVWLRKV